MFSNFPVVHPHVKSERLRAVAITSLKRSPLAPEFPTIAESGIPGFDTATWSGLYLPGGTPRDVIRRVHADIDKIQKAPAFKKRMLELGIDQSDADTPEKHAAFVQSETAKWGKVIREAGVKVE
jgi:tripartite-type tricarboxylate transporter receptor subunit TctC